MFDVMHRSLLETLRRHIGFTCAKMLHNVVYSMRCFLLHIANHTCMPTDLDYYIKRDFDSSLASFTYISSSLSVHCRRISVAKLYALASHHQNFSAELSVTSEARFLTA